MNADEVVRLHDEIIRLTGGRSGIISRERLESSLVRPFQGLADGTELFPNLFAKAAALFEALVRWHSFVDGNKRTAVMVVILFLASHGIELEHDVDELVALCEETAAGQWTHKQLAIWIADRARPAAGAE